jgi:hypothetical protein
MTIGRAKLAVIGMVALALSASAQTSSPTPMTPKMMRGPDWSRIRTAMPAIIAGRYLDRTRAGGAPMSWNAAASLTGFGQVTFFEAMEKQETLFVRDVEASSTEKVSPEIAKNLDYHLTPDEVSAVKKKLASKGDRMVAYDVPTIGPDEAENRKLFQFAKDL